MAPTQSTLLTLPTELRLEILDLLIVEHELELRPQTTQPGSPLWFSNHPLTQTCRQLRIELTQQFPKAAPKLCPHVKVSMASANMDPLAAFMGRFGTDARSRISRRKVKLSLPMDFHSDGMLHR